MTISEGDDNLIKCNKIPSESAVSESLAYFTRNNSETEFVMSIFIVTETERRKILQVTRRMLFLCLCTNLTKREKHDKSLQTYPVGSHTVKKVGRTISLYAAFYKQ